MWVRVAIGGKIRVMKAKRYWPGKAEWAYNDDDYDEGGLMIRASASAPEKAFCSSNPVSSDDPRLRRLAQSRIANGGDQIRRIMRAEIVSMGELEEEEEEGDEALAKRRRKIREKVLQEEAALLPEEEEEEEEESEYETDPEEEVSMVKHVFVPKSDRDTTVEREKVEAGVVEANRNINLKRKRETKEIVVEKIKENTDIIGDVNDDDDDDDDDDDVDEAEEYEGWKGREIGRIKRDRNMREVAIEKREYCKRNKPKASKKKWRRRRMRFMQRDYHKGCFFQIDGDGDGDFYDPTGEDKMDKSILPKVMQVKHFGRRGRTKWTHLLNEDTTHFNSSK